MGWYQRVARYGGSKAAFAKSDLRMGIRYVGGAEGLLEGVVT